MDWSFEKLDVFFRGNWRFRLEEVILKGFIIFYLVVEWLYIVGVREEKVRLG